jgi:tetratricopeptide (TPR) repeat protein
MGRIYYKYKEYDVAMKAFEDALDIYSDAPLDQRIRIANTLNHLGLTQFMSPKEVTGAYHTLKYFNLAQSIYEEKGSEINEDFADILVNKGVLLAQEGEFLQSITYYNKAITIYRTLFGNDSVKISIILEKLGSCLIQQREFKEALAIFKEALELRKKNGRENDLETANILFGMGIIMCESGKLNKALDYYEQTLNIRREILGTNNVEVGLVLNNVGSVFARNKEYTRAQGPWQSAIDIYRNAGLSDEHPKLVCTLGNLNIVSKSLVSTAPVKPLRKMDVY